MMSEIILTPEQAAIVGSMDKPLRVYNPDGSVVGWLSRSRLIVPKQSPFTPEEIAAAEKESESVGPWYTTQEVLDHLRSLGPAQP
jgi:hypothetical protein